MSNQLAREIFDILITELRSNSFGDVATFMIDEFDLKDDVYEKQDSTYEYIDTDSTIQQYIQESNSEEGGLVALEKLLRAGIRYFTLAGNIPNEFKQRIASLYPTDDDRSIGLNLSENNSVILSEVLDNSNIRQIIGILEFLVVSLDKDDELVISELLSITK